VPHISLLISVQVRSVCLRQFVLRVIGGKIAAQQQQKEGQRRSYPSDAARNQAGGGRPGPVVLPQGDSWSSAGMAARYG
jgi:hypothetical protein